MIENGSKITDKNRHAKIRTNHLQSASRTSTLPSMVHSVMAPMMKVTVANTPTELYLVEHTGDTINHGLVIWLEPFIHLHGPSAVAAAAVTSPLHVAIVGVAVVTFWTPSLRLWVEVLNRPLTSRTVMLLLLKMSSW